MEYRRNLPHFQPDGAALFITFRLYGTLPLVSGRDGRAFWLEQPRVAECVAETIRHGERERARALYGLAAFVVMPNHVHLPIDPIAPAPGITQFVKGVSARQANALLCRTGQPFWQDETYDHCIRNSDELNRVIRYIERNPVRAGLARAIEDWRWSSASAGQRPTLQEM